MSQRNSPGQIRDAIVGVLHTKVGDWSVREIRAAVADELAREVPASSVRSYLRLNPELFRCTARGRYQLIAEPQAQLELATDLSDAPPLLGNPSEQPAWAEFKFGKSRLVQADCFEWLE